MLIGRKRIFLVRDFFSWLAATNPPAPERLRPALLFERSEGGHRTEKPGPLALGCSGHFNYENR